MVTKKINVFDYINTITDQLRKKIDIRDVQITFSINNIDHEKDLTCTVFYTYGLKDSCFNVYNYNIDKNPISIDNILRSCLIEVEKIIIEKSDIFTV